MTDREKKGRPRSVALKEETYVIYDQFHWHTPDHIEVPVSKWETALEVYKFLKDLHPGESLGLVTKEEFLKIKKSYKNDNHQNS